MADLDEILAEVKVTSALLKDLKATDIPEIKGHLVKINGITLNHEGRVSSLESTRGIMLKILIPVIVGAVAAALRLVGVY